MYHQTCNHFGEVEKVLASAMHSAGHTDREIADACRTSVNNIIWWREREGLRENLSPGAQARAAEARYVPVRGPVPGVAGVTPAADPRLAPPAHAPAAFAAPVQPTGENALEIGL